MPAAISNVPTKMNTLITMPTIWSIAIGVFLLFLQLYWGTLTMMVQVPFFILFMALAGIPHGAVDHLIEAETAKRQQKSFNLFIFLTKYIATMLLYAAAWYVFPSVSLLFFLLISAWHFGETDIEKAPQTVLWTVMRLMFGCFVLLWLLLTHVAETTPIIERISQNDIYVLRSWQWMCAQKVVVLPVLLCSVVVLFLLAYRSREIAVNLLRYVQLATILVLCYFLPLLPAFALYFGGWHSLCSFETIDHYLSSQTVSDVRVSPLRLLKTWYKSLPFNLLAISSLGAATAYWFYFLQQWDPLPLLFIFLSLITLPHLNVMRAVNKLD